MLPAALEALRRSSEPVPRARPLPLGLASLDQALPEGGLPRGAVIEIASARGLGRSTTIALSAVASAQRLARARSGDESTSGAWCAFVDPSSSLHAPGLASTSVDPARLLVVRPPASALARTAVKLVQARVFAVVVVDLVEPIGGHRETGGAFGLRARAHDKLCNWVRRLSIANEKGDATVILLTDSLVARPLPLPVAMRIDVERRRGRARSASVAANHNATADEAVAPSVTDSIWFHVSKERRGRVRPASPFEIDKPAHLVRIVPPASHVLDDEVDVAALPRPVGVLP